MENLTYPRLKFRPFTLRLIV